MAIQIRPGKLLAGVSLTVMLACSPGGVSPAIPRETTELEPPSPLTSPTASGSAESPSGPGPGGSGESIAPTVETDPVPSSGDAADDPAIWVDSENPSRSRVIGTDKQSGLAVYDLAGRQVQFVAGGTPNNVDLREGFPLGGDLVALVVAADDSDSSLPVYAVDIANGNLVPVAARRITVGVVAHGICLYRSPDSGRFYAFPNAKDGRTEQWELFDDGSGSVDARKVRGPWDVGGEVEGCVADDGLGHLYISEENEGIWKYPAEPDEPTSVRTLVDGTGSAGHLAADVEGLAILYRAEGSGLLFASSQGDDSFLVYRRDGANDFVGRFRVEEGAVDGCEETDGIDVSGAALGSEFSEGLFVCQDGSNQGANQNFKLVPLERIL